MQCWSYPNKNEGNGNNPGVVDVNCVWSESDDRIFLGELYSILNRMRMNYSSHSSNNTTTTASTTTSQACNTSRKKPAAAAVGKRNTTNCSRYYHPPQNDEMSTPANADDNQVGNSHRENISDGGKIEPRLPTEHKNEAVEESNVQTDE